MAKRFPKVNWRFLLSVLLFVSLLLSIIFVAIRLAQAPEETTAVGENTKSDYVLMLVQCSLGLIVMFLPSMLERRFGFIFPGSMYVMYLIFLYCAIYLGEVRNFYYIIPFWDSILHCFSGAMLGAIGFFVVNVLNQDEHVTMKMSPFFVALFAFCFAIMLGVIWEVYEFTVDGLLGLNMQKFALQDGTPLAGRAALSDTMSDLIINCVGAGVMCVIGYVSIKKGTGWMKRFSLKRFKNKKDAAQNS